MLYFLSRGLKIVDLGHMYVKVYFHILIIIYLLYSSKYIINRELSTMITLDDQVNTVKNALTY